MQVEGLDTTFIDYIDELKTNYENQIHKLENEKIEYQNKYLYYKERYELEIYKRYMRSAEQIPVDGKQPLLFGNEIEPEEAAEQGEEGEEKTEVRSYSRTKRGRKPIDPRLPREIEIIYIADEEKICAYGAKPTKIGEEISEKLEFTPQRIYKTDTATKIRVPQLRGDRGRGGVGSAHSRSPAVDYPAQHILTEPVKRHITARKNNLRG